MATGFNVRIGDADRDAIAAQLREHYADGRLTLDELNERLDHTFAAKTTADLDAVMRDLPHVPRPVGAPLVGSTTGSGWDSGSGYSRRGRSFGAFAPALGLMWAFLILGALMLFGLGGGDRPLAVVVLLAVFALLKRLFSFGVRRGGRGGRGGGGGGKGPRGPKGSRGGRGGGRGGRFI